MAKRRKTKGGGAFGKPRGSKPIPPAIVRPAAGSDHSTDRTMKLVGRILEGMDFQNEEDARRFLEERIIGSSPEELAAMLGGLGPETDLDRAERLIDEIPEDATDAHIVRTAKEALAISEDCMAAWLQLGMYEETDERAMERLDLGIERGRKRFADLIAEAGPGRGLWGHVEARDFMRMLGEKAKLHAAAGEIEKGIAIYREMLALNPHDNQGIRADLLRLLMAMRRIPEGRELLDAYPRDADAAMAWGNVFVSVCEAVDASGYVLPDDMPDEAMESAAAFLRTLGPEFDGAREAVKQAAEVNPFVPMLFMDGGIFEVETDEMVVMGGPYEAIVYLQRWGMLWHVNSLAMAFMVGAYPRNPKKFLRGRRVIEEFDDVMCQLEDFSGKPWWEQVAEDLDGK